MFEMPHSFLIWKDFDVYAGVLERRTHAVRRTIANPIAGMLPRPVIKVERAV